VCIEEIDALGDALRAGFRPDAVLVDGASRHGRKVSASVRHHSAIQADGFGSLAEGQKVELDVA
jgi:hypothetical protein